MARPTEQVGQHTIPRRTSARKEELRQRSSYRTTAPQQGSRHQVSTAYRAHDDTAPYLSRDVQPTPRGQKGFDDAEYDDDYPQHTPRSVVRHRPLPATRVQEEQPRSRISFRGFLFVCGGVLFVAILIANLIVMYILPTITNWNYDRLYGYPRMYRTEANTEHGTRTHPNTRYIAINNGGVIEIAEIPEGDLSATSSVHLYVLIRVTGSDADKIPITNITFSDANGDGKPDMLVARYADACNFTHPSPEELAQKFALIE